MTLLRVPDPFDHPDWLFELKLDGFRALAHIEGHHCTLVSRRGHTFKYWPYLEIELAHAIRCDSAILDGWVRRSEIRPVRRSESDPPEGRSFYADLARRQ